ncbi:hypothetical protein BKA57DRAFT_62356 [Linnemannia elongata]|nr:hypothetical protein BKA57DRAFT_62356 [Linnemannia elongata]
MNRCTMSRCGKRPSGIINNKNNNNNNSNKPATSIIATAAMIDTLLLVPRVRSGLGQRKVSMCRVVSCVGTTQFFPKFFLFSHFLLLFTKRPLFFFVFLLFYSFLPFSTLLSLSLFLSFRYHPHPPF